MTTDEFYVCIDKTVKAICSEGHIHLSYIDPDALDDFRELVAPENIGFDEFKAVILEQCHKLAKIFQKSYKDFIHSYHRQPLSCYRFFTARKPVFREI